MLVCYKIHQGCVEVRENLNNGSPKNYMVLGKEVKETGNKSTLQAACNFRKKNAHGNNFTRHCVLTTANCWLSHCFYWYETADKYLDKFQRVLYLDMPCSPAVNGENPDVTNFDRHVPLWLGTSFRFVLTRVLPHGINIILC